MARLKAMQAGDVSMQEMWQEGWGRIVSTPSLSQVIAAGSLEQLHQRSDVHGSRGMQCHGAVKLPAA